MRLTQSTHSTLGRVLPQLGWMLTVLLIAGIYMSPRPIAAGFAIGYVDTESAMKGHPGFDAALQSVGQYRATRLAELDAYKGRTLTDAEKKELFVKNETISADIDKKHDEVMAPLANEVELAIDAVGKESGVEVVLESAAVHFGGVDLTSAVISKLKK